MPLARVRCSVWCFELRNIISICPQSTIEEGIGTEYACLKGFDAIALHEKIDEPKLRRRTNG